jgi:hypothetical protein
VLRDSSRVDDANVRRAPTATLAVHRLTVEVASQPSQSFIQLGPFCQNPGAPLLLITHLSMVVGSYRSLVGAYLIT